jgi:predicted transcriptional regulator
VPTGQKYETVINEDNARDILSSGIESWPIRLLDQRGEGIKDVFAWTKIAIYPANDAVYINFRSTNVEEPVVLGKSRCVYSSGVYVLDEKGMPVLEKITCSTSSLFAFNNSTIYFMDGSGKISAWTVVIAGAGILALIGAALAIVKFVGIGSVTRARSRVDKNENRNTLLLYIIDNPGVTIYDISKAIGMNRGTVRYHLLILELNHRIAVFKDDSKFIRYFPNSNRYSKEEQQLISIVRRDAIKRVIQLLFMKPGLTNSEISNVTGLANSGVSRYLKELCDKGIALRSEAVSGRYAYSLTDEASQTVEKLYWVINNEGKGLASGSGSAEA